jgi:hypothetical protein
VDENRASLAVIGRTLGTGQGSLRAVRVEPLRLALPAGTLAADISTSGTLTISDVDSPATLDRKSVG